MSFGVASALIWCNQRRIFKCPLYKLKMWLPYLLKWGVCTSSCSFFLPSHYTTVSEFLCSSVSHFTTCKLVLSQNFFGVLWFRWCEGFHFASFSIHCTKYQICVEFTLTMSSSLKLFEFLQALFAIAESRPDMLIIN